MDMMDRLPTRADEERQAKRDAASTGRTNMEITVDVTERNIKEGKPGSTLFCPVALALDAMDYTGVHVATDHVEVMDGQIMLSGPLPRAASDFIEAFDDAEDEDARALDPISFKVSLKEVRDGD